jgi:transposase-like protein
MREKRRKFTPEFKSEVVRLVEPPELYADAGKDLWLV